MPCIITNVIFDQFVTLGFKLLLIFLFKVNNNQKYKIVQNNNNFKKHRRMYLNIYEKLWYKCFKR